VANRHCSSAAAPPDCLTGSRISVALTACLQSARGYASNVSSDRVQLQQVLLTLLMNVIEGFARDPK
jgi:hypothetical protein